MIIKKPDHKAEQKTAGHPASQVKHDHDTPHERPKTQSQHEPQERQAALREQARPVSHEEHRIRPGGAVSVPQPTFHDLGHAAAEALECECATPEGRKVFYAGDGVARATVLRDQALLLAARFSEFIRA